MSWVKFSSSLASLWDSFVDALHLHHISYIYNFTIRSEESTEGKAGSSSRRVLVSILLPPHYSSSSSSCFTPENLQACHANPACLATSKSSDISIGSINSHLPHLALIKTGRA